MSKFSKHLKDRAYRKQTREVNRLQNRGIQKFSEIDPRSTRETFDLWCEECGDDLGVYSGVLSIAGSDGITVTDTKVGDAPINNPAAVDQEFRKEMYYEEGWVNMHSYFYHPPKMTYLEWFNKKFNKD